MLCSASGALRAVAVCGFALLLTGSFSGCGQAPSSTPGWQTQVDSCAAAPADQKDSFMAPIGNGPVTLMVDNTFTSDQQTGIQTMVTQWNQLGQTLRGADFFTLQTATVPSVLYTGNFQQCNIDVGTGTGALYLVNMTDETQWESLGFATTIPGATVRCYQNDYLDKQVVMVRPDLIDAAQFTSVILHELGHSLGLDHSCNAKGGSSSFLSCNGVDQENDPDYYNAVMFPTLSSGISANGTPMVKDQLAPNDTARASCLY